MTGEGDASGVWRPSLLLALVLLGLAGFVDAVGLLSFGLFPSFMSGDTTQMSAAFAAGRSAQAGVLAGAVVIFVAGAFLGRLVGLSTGRRSAVLWLEAAVLALAAAAEHFGVGAGALALTVLAMGAQTTVLTHAGAVTVGTTYVTGALSRTGAALADALAGGSWTEWLAYLLLWIALAAGAAAGALCYARVGDAALRLAAAGCAAVATVAWMVEQRTRPRAS